MAAPATPAGLAVDQTASNAVKLSWGNVADETGFHLWKSYDSEVTYESIADIPEDTLTHYDMDCGFETEYYYKISAYNADGESALSASVNTTTLAKSAKDSFWSDLKRGYDANSIYRREVTTKYGQRSTGSMLVEREAVSSDEVPAYSQLPTAIPPADGTYVVISDVGGLSDQRILTAGTGITITDAGAGSTVTLSLSGDLPAKWKSWDVEPFAVKLPGANPPAEATKDGFPFLRFDRGTEESVYYMWTVPNDFKTGTGSVKGYFKFLVENPPVSPATDEAVVMGFEYKSLSEGDVFDFDAGTSSGTITETIAADETADIIHHTSYGTCDTTGWVVGDTILFRLYRDATNVNDTYDNEASAADNDVWLYDLHLEYQVDKLGGTVA